MRGEQGTSERLAEAGRDRLAWQAGQQVFELAFHQGSGGDWRYDERWNEARVCLQRFHAIDFSRYRGRRIIDVGSGPRSMCEWFEDARITCIEPLGDEYAKIPKTRLDHPRIERVWGAPAEEHLAQLDGTADFVWCHNCLDHCYSWRTVVDNIARYLKPTGEFYLSTDAGKPASRSHPGIESVDALVSHCRDAGLDIRRMHLRTPDEPLWIRTVTLQGRKGRSAGAVTIPFRRSPSRAARSTVAAPAAGRRFKIEELEIFGVETLTRIGFRGRLAVVGNGPLSAGCLKRINAADVVVRFNDWNRRKSYDRQRTGDRCELLCTHYDSHPKIGPPDGFPVPRCVAIAIPSPFHCDRIIEYTDRWYAACRVAMVNPYVNRLICRELRLDSDGWSHPLPTAGFTFLYHLWTMMRDRGLLRECYVTGFDWRVNRAAETVDRVPVAGDDMPRHYNHSYLRECQWICRHLRSDGRFSFSAPAADALAFVAAGLERGTSPRAACG